MIDLFNLQYTPRKFFNNKTDAYLTDNEMLDIVKEVFNNNCLSISVDNVFEEENKVLFIHITCLDDDYSAFTLIMRMVNLVLPKVDLSTFFELDELMECYYETAYENHEGAIRALIREIKSNLN